MLLAPSRKGRQRQKKGAKGRFQPTSRTGGETPLKPPFVTPPFAASQVHIELFDIFWTFLPCLVAALFSNSVQNMNLTNQRPLE